jgi:hypothetical protein
VGWLVNNESERIWEEVITTWCEVSREYRHLVWGQRKTTKFLDQDRRRASRDLNRASLECQSSTLLYMFTEYCDMTPESRNNEIRRTGNEYARNNRITSVSKQQRGKHSFIRIEDLLGNGVFCESAPRLYNENLKQLELNRVPELTVEAEN